jgi:nucleotide-binding universal stress UspA family protein
MYQNILVPVDGSELARKAIKEAAGLAKSSGAKMVLFHAVRPHTAPLYTEGMSAVARDTKKEHAEIEQQARRVLNEATADAQFNGVTAQSEYAVSDSPYQAIIDSARKNQCDLIAMSSHGHGVLGGLLLGSETQKVLANSKVPVLVIR